MLIAFVQEARDRGGSINGNLIYQQFAEEVRFFVQYAMPNERRC